MKKSVKIVIIVLSLIIVGLITFIIVDKAILSKNNGTSKSENSTVNQVDNGKGSSVNVVEENEIDTINNTTDNSVNGIENKNEVNNNKNNSNSGNTTNSNNQSGTNSNENERIKQSLLNKGWYEDVKKELGDYISTKDQTDIIESESRIYKIDSSRAGIPIYLVELCVAAKGDGRTFNYIGLVRGVDDKVIYDYFTSTKNGWDSVKVDDSGLVFMTEKTQKGYINNIYYHIYEKGYTILEQVVLTADVDGTSFKKTVYDAYDNVKEEKDLSKAEYDEIKKSYENQGLKEMSITLTKENADKYIKD